MRKQRLAAVREVRTTFISAEQALDSAAIEAARCVLTALEQRSANDLPIGFGAEAIAHLGRAAQLSLEARNALIMAHPILAELPAKIGVTRAAGDVDPCPPLEGLAATELKVVA